MEIIIGLIRVSAGFLTVIKVYNKKIPGNPGTLY